MVLVCVLYCESTVMRG